MRTKVSIIRCPEYELAAVVAAVEEACEAAGFPDVKGKTVLMIDDMITTGGTISEASKILKENGAAKIYVAATHGVFAGKAIEKIVNSPIDRIIITDTIPPCDRLKPIMDRLTVLSVTNLVGDAIQRIHLNQSVSGLLRGAAGGKR